MPECFQCRALRDFLFIPSDSGCWLAWISLIMKLVHSTKHEMSNILNKCVCWRQWASPLWRPGLVHTRLQRNGKEKAATVTNAAGGWAKSVTHNALRGNFAVEGKSYWQSTIAWKSKKKKLFERLEQNIGGFGGKVKKSYDGETS